MLEERLKYIDLLINFINTFEDENFAKMSLPPRYDCVFSLYMMKQKCSMMKIMREEFNRESKEIKYSRIDWNYLGRFGIYSFWGKENWFIWNEEFYDRLKAIEKELSSLAMQGKESILPPIVVNTLSIDFTILVGMNMLIQNLPITHYYIWYCLIVAIRKYKVMPWMLVEDWDKITKVRRLLNHNIILE